MKLFTIQEINKLVNGKIIGDCFKKIDGAEELKKAKENDITFIGNNKYAKFWATSKACVAIVHENINIKPGKNRGFIKVKNPDLAMALLLKYLEPELPYFSSNIHPTASIETSALIGKGCKIGAGTYVGKDVVLGENVVLYPNVTIFDNTKIGNNTVIWSGTVLRERTEIGENCILHNNVSIGADGFGYTNAEGRGLIKIPHIGNVILGNNVEIGANTCIDKGKFSATILGDGCKIDNLVQIGHNCVLGKFCIISGTSGLAGSVTLGDGVVIGGGASIKDHITIGAGATVGGGSGVIANVKAGKTVLGTPAADYRDTLKQWVALKKIAKG